MDDNLHLRVYIRSMRSRAFFFTVIALIGIALFAGVIYLWRSTTGSGTVAQKQERAHIRTNKTANGTITDIAPDASSLTVTDNEKREVTIVIVPETKIVGKNGATTNATDLYRDATIEVKGEGATTDAMIAAEIRIISIPEVIVSTPNGTDPVVSPLTIEGKAIGPWYFEASFPITVADEQKRALGKGVVTATSDWMTESLVPFTATIEFTQPTTPTGYLIFKKDNPSGLEENSKTFEMPITFSSTASRTVKVFFNNSKLDPAFLCTTVFPVTRTIPWTEGVGRAAIEELIKGPTAQEKTANYFTNIDSSVRINDIRVENGVAKIDLSEALEKNSGGSCRVTAIRAQITKTLEQFSSVKDVVISINGRTEDILQP